MSLEHMTPEERRTGIGGPQLRAELDAWLAGELATLAPAIKDLSRLHRSGLIAPQTWAPVVSMLATYLEGLEVEDSVWRSWIEDDA